VKALLPLSDTKFVDKYTDTIYNRSQLYVRREEKIHSYYPLIRKVKSVNYSRLSESD